MKWRRATIVAGLTLLALAPTLSAQRQSGPLVGTWRVVRFCDQDSTGATPSRWAPAPVGYFVYAPTGQLSIQVMRTPPAGPLAGGPVRLDSLNDLRPYYFGYFGTYTILSDSTVVHHVEGGTLPNYIGTDQRRGYRIRGDTLSIGDPPYPCRVLIRVK